MLCCRHGSSFFASFTIRSLGFEPQCELARMSLQNTDIIDKVLVDCRDVHGLEKKLSTLRSENEEFSSVFRKFSASSCLLGLFSLKFHILSHLIGDLKRLGDDSFIDAGPLEHSHVLTVHFYKTRLGRLCTKMHENGQ